MANNNKHIFKNDTITLTECNGFFWLYDKTRGMNLAMRAKTEQCAFVKALEFYQKRLSTVETDFKELNAKVNTFIKAISIDED